MNQRGCCCCSCCLLPVNLPETFRFASGTQGTQMNQRGCCCCSCCLLPVNLPVNLPETFRFASGTQGKQMHQRGCCCCCCCPGKILLVWERFSPSGEESKILLVSGRFSSSRDDSKILLCLCLSPPPPPPSPRLLPICFRFASGLLPVFCVTSRHRRHTQTATTTRKKLQKTSRSCSKAMLTRWRR